jgi:hypothetical protein
MDLPDLTKARAGGSTVVVRPALARPVACYFPRHGLVNHTKHGDNEVVQVHGTLLRSVATGTEEAPVAIGTMAAPLPLLAPPLGAP